MLGLVVGRTNRDLKRFERHTDPSFQVSRRAFGVARRVGCLVLGLIGLGSTPAMAQDHSTQEHAARANFESGQRPVWALVLNSAQRKMDPTLETLLEPLTHHLNDMGVETLDPWEASRIFERRHSSRARVLDPQEIAEVAERTRVAARHLAIGEAEAARNEYEALGSLTNRLASEGTVDAKGARELLNGCLVLVRYLMRHGNDAEARVQTQECVRRAPFLEPDPDLHPPHVRELYATTKDELRIGPQATLQVNVDREIALALTKSSLRVDRDTPEGSCKVNLNGIGVGYSPWAMTDVLPGTVWVQVTCGDEPGRLHHVQLRPGMNLLDVDPQFERAVETDGALGLHYGERISDFVAHRVEHGLRLGQQLRVDGILLVTPSALSAHQYRLDRIDVQGEPKAKVTASVEIAVHPDSRGRDVLHLAVLDLLEKRSRTWADPRFPTAIAAWGSETQASGSVLGSSPGTSLRETGSTDITRSHRQQVLPWVGSALGLTLLGTGWWSYARVRKLGGDLNRLDMNSSRFASVRRNQQRARWGLLGTGWAAGTLLAISLPEVLHEELERDPNRKPWLGVAAGAAGVGLLAGSTWAWIADGRCELKDTSGACLEYADTADLGTMMAIHSLPLLSVAVRGWLATRHAAGVPRRDASQNQRFRRPVAFWAQGVPGGWLVGVTGAVR